MDIATINQKIIAFAEAWKNSQQNNEEIRYEIAARAMREMSAMFPPKKGKDHEEGC